jgi:excisionase family DNA binding protein
MSLPELTMQDVRLAAGEGKLTAEDVIRAANAVLRSHAKFKLSPDAKLAYTVDEAGPALGLGRTTVFDMIREGEITAKKVRGRTVIPREELQRILDEAPSARAA